MIDLSKFKLVNDFNLNMLSVAVGASVDDFIFIAHKHESKYSGVYTLAYDSMEVELSEHVGVGIKLLNKSLTLSKLNRIMGVTKFEISYVDIPDDGNPLCIEVSQRIYFVSDQVHAVCPFIQGTNIVKSIHIGAHEEPVEIEYPVFDVECLKLN